MDRSEEAIAFAQERFGSDVLQFRRADGQAIPFPDHSFDVVCSFEVIEHVADQAAFVREIARVLHPTGTALISTPVSDGESESPNPFHVRELSPDNFVSMIRSDFSDVILLGHRLRANRFVRKLRQERVGIRRMVPRAVKRILLALVHDRIPEDHDRDEVDAFEFVPDLQYCTVMVAIASGPRQNL
jgi:SAM-dependent methyltransferase